MLDISYEIALWYSKIKVLLTPEVLTVLVILLILFRGLIIKSILRILGRFFNIPKEDQKNFPTKSLRGFITLTGIFLINLIWVKNNQFIVNFGKIYKIIGIIILARTIVNILHPNSIFIKAIEKNEKFNINVELLSNTFIFNIFKYIIYIIALFIIITDMGYNINGLVAGLGIGSAIIALAVQDIVKSFISGASIITEKPFEIGNLVQIGLHIGTVENITLRNTVIRLKDNSLMSIPNSLITTEYLINLDKIENRRIDINLHFNFNTDLEKLERIISKIRYMLENNSKVIEDTVNISLLDILDTGLNVIGSCYITEYKYKRYLEVKEKINIEILKILRSENVNPMYKVNEMVINEPMPIKIEKKKTATKLF